MTDKLAIAAMIAERAHDGQKRHNGDPYVVHPLRVSAYVGGMGGNEDLQVLAELHDVGEDCDPKLRDALFDEIKKYFGHDMFALVGLMTHKKGIPYNDYIRDSICLTRSTMIVKMADIIDNLCDDPTERQRVKYREGMRIILKSQLTGTVARPDNTAPKQQ